VAKRIRDEFAYGPDDERVVIVAEAVPVLVCPQCGETLYGPEAAHVRHQAICRTLGLLTPEQIKSMRERLGKSQAEFAQLTGIGVATLSRWERGRLLQTRALDRYLRLLDVLPGAVPILESLNVPTAARPERFRCLQVTDEIRARAAQFRLHKQPDPGTGPDMEAETPTDQSTAPASGQLAGQ
jgi:putative zinc finger/helix-turn-helix YgiT family protein